MLTMNAIFTSKLPLSVKMGKAKLEKQGFESKYKFDSDSDSIYIICVYK